MSIPEQVPTLDQVFCLKKKFYVFDANLDRNDPVELHLVYCQCRDEIVGGIHPCSKDEAIQFCALQCQILEGDYIPSKHKSELVL